MTQPPPSPATLPHTKVHIHDGTTGYGGNQKTCYRLALEAGADIVIMVHPDYQYTPKLIPAMASMIGNGLYPCVLGSRILGGIGAQGRHAALEVRRQPVPHLRRKPPPGREAFRVPHRLPGLLPGTARKPALEAIPTTSSSTTRCWRRSSGWADTIAEVSCPTKYFAEASSINFKRSIRYGFGCLWTALNFRLARMGIIRSRLFPVDP